MNSTVDPMAWRLVVTTWYEVILSYWQNKDLIAAGEMPIGVDPRWLAKEHPEILAKHRPDLLAIYRPDYSPPPKPPKKSRRKRKGAE